MWFTSDNASGAAPEVIAALAAANAGYTRGYGAEEAMERVTARIRALFRAPEAAVFLVPTGTVANALALSALARPFDAILAHADAHIAQDECGAPEFYAGGAKIVAVPGAHGKMSPETLSAVLARVGEGGVHGHQRGPLSITNVTEAGTVYTPGEVAALTALARARGLSCHMDGARFANALVATGATAAEMTRGAGIDALSFGGTKNGCLGVEAVVLFDPDKAWETELRRKRGGHLFSKHRYLAAQMEAYLEGDLWLRLAERANAMGAYLAEGLASLPAVTLDHPVQANMAFVTLPPGTNARAEARGARYYAMPAPEGMEAARFVASWCTTRADVDGLIAALG